MKEIVSNGVLYKNPLFMYAVGLCPIVAAVTTLKEALIISGITAFLTILICILTNLIFKRYSSLVRLSLYVISAIILFIPAAMLAKLVLPLSYSNVGLHTTLLIFNTLYLYRSEGFARKNSFSDSLLDAVSTSFGYMLGACIVGAIREILSRATIWDIKIPFEYAVNAISKPFGGLIIIGFVAAVFTAVSTSLKSRKSRTGIFVQTQKHSKKSSALRLLEEQENDAEEPVEQEAENEPKDEAALQ